MEAGESEHWEKPRFFGADETVSAGKLLKIL